MKNYILTMKIIKQAFALCIIACSTCTLKAQIASSTKPLLFNNSSPSLTAAATELDKAFAVKEGGSIQLNFANQFTFDGTVLSSVQRYGKLSSILIKSPSLLTTLLSVSKSLNAYGSFPFVGRYLNDSHAVG